MAARASAIERQHYYDDGPRVGIYGGPRFMAPGIGVNIGVDDDRWQIEMRN